MKIQLIKIALLLFFLPMTVIAADVPVAEKKIDTIKKVEVDKEKLVVVNLTKPLVYDRTVKGGMNEVYAKVFTALENNSYYVILEPNLGKTLSHFSKRWGDDYNKNKLTSIRSMVFCNGWYANKISNEDPKLLALCPMRITLYSKDKETHILFVRPGRVAGNSPAQKTAKEMEDDVIRTIEVAIAN